MQLWVAGAKEGAGRPRKSVRREGPEEECDDPGVGRATCRKKILQTGDGEEGGVLGIKPEGRRC